MSIEIELAAQAEQRIAAKALARADKEVETGLECIELYTRKARMVLADLLNCVDEESAEAAAKALAWNVEELREYVATMGRDVEMLRDAWLARHRAGGAE